MFQCCVEMFCFITQLSLDRPCCRALISIVSALVYGRPM